VLTVQFYNAANQPLGAPLTRAGGQTALAWYQLQLADVPVPCGAAWADVYVEQTATDYQTWFDDFEITLLGAPVATIVQEGHRDAQSTTRAGDGA
jgi:hypothetical protein